MPTIIRGAQMKCVAFDIGGVIGFGRLMSDADGEWLTDDL